MNTDSHNIIAGLAPGISRPHNSWRSCWAGRYFFNHTLRDVGSTPYNAIAKLGKPAAEGNPPLLEIHICAGSSGLAVRADQLREIAHDYPWALSETSNR